MHPEPTPHAAAWIGFHVGLLLLLAAELLFSRLGLPRDPTARLRRQRRNAVAATLLWLCAALALAAVLAHRLGSPAATQFLAGYAIEQSLSLDNLFVFLLLFRSFGIQPTAQPRILFWGVLGAILMRAAMISAGIGLLDRFDWLSWLFGLILLVAAIRLVLPHGPEEESKPPIIVRWLSHIHPVSPRQDSFFAREAGRRLPTILLLALLAIEFADVLFAVDSIPAVLSITREPFLAYTSNILAVMSLRSLYFLLAEALRRLRFLHYGLAAILAFAAAKMLLAPRFEIAPVPSLVVIVVLLLATVAASLLWRGPPSPRPAA